MSSVVPQEASTIHWSALFSWLVACACSLVALQKRARVRKLVPPSSRQLLRELELEGPSVDADDITRRLAIAELNQRLSDVAFELDVMPSTFTALTRICLASGSGLALVGFLTAVELPVVLRTARLAVAAAAGLVGALVVAIVGRSAKEKAREIREKWDTSSREIGKALGASLASTESRPNSR